MPPLFGVKTFAAVVNNHSWPIIDKKYLKQLVDFRAQADDVLHRPISEAEDLFSVGHLPLPMALNRLLQECAAALRESKRAQPSE